MEFLINFIVAGAGLLILLVICLAIFSPEMLVDAAEFVVRLVFGKSVESLHQKMSQIPVGPIGRVFCLLLTIGVSLWLYRFYSIGLH